MTLALIGVVVVVAILVVSMLALIVKAGRVLFAMDQDKGE